MPKDEKKDDEKQDNGFSSKLLQARTILINGEVDQELAEKVIAQLVVLDRESHDPIRIIVNSNGGHVDSGYAVHDMLRYVDSKIVAIGAGWVASIAVPILFGAKKENRYTLPNTRFLLHQPHGGAGGQVSDIRIEAQEILKIRERINKLVAEETGQAVDKVAGDSDRNFWMDAEEAVAYGLVSKVIRNADELS